MNPETLKIMIQGFAGPRRRSKVKSEFSTFPLNSHVIVPSFQLFFPTFAVVNLVLLKTSLLSTSTYCRVMSTRTSP